MAIMGIDLGTTYSVMATMEDGRVVVLSNVEGKQTTPSVVFFQDDSLDNVLVGDSAVFSAGTDPDRAVRAIKRHMGTDFKLNRGPGYTPEQVSASILKKMKADAESSLGEKVSDVVITVPAYFEAPERDATKKAGEMAGFTVRALLAEPIAAAIDFAQTRGEDLVDKTVLVYDLGGGTFDVTAMKVSRTGAEDKSPLAFDIVGKDGSRELGGLDWDRALAEHVAGEFAQAHPGKNPTDDPRSFDILLLQCQQAKEALSFKDLDGTVSVACTHDGVTHPITVSRRKFEELTLGLLTQTIDKTSQLVANLGDKGISWQSIDFILLAGGSTKMPAVNTMLEQIAGKKPVTNRGVDFNVGRGAAYLAFSPDAWTDKAGVTKEEKGKIEKEGPKGGSKISVLADIANHSVGINVWDPSRNKDFNYILLKKDTPVNQRSKEEVFQTVEDNQTAVDIIINKGESEELDDVSVKQLGTVRISNLPPGPAGQQIKVWLCYNSDGLITGEATHAGSGRKAEIKVSLNKKAEGEA